MKLNHDEFAFFNQQLAAMLREGIPLEGALRQLASDLKHEPLRTEITALEKDLSRGTPLKDALSQRTFPELYRRMLEIGAQSQDLPALLTLLADHYQRSNVLFNRLKGLLVYPLIVVFVALGLTVIASVVFGKILVFFSEGSIFFSDLGSAIPFLLAAMWFPPVVLAILAIVGVTLVLHPRLRAWLRWKVPAFREASLSHLASSLAVMTRNGVPLPEALALAGTVESASSIGNALARWRQLIESGQGHPANWPASIGPLPPLFLWLVRKGGENIASGFEKAAEIYRARASYKIELALYGALPVSVLLVGQLIFWQVVPLFRVFAIMLDSLGFAGD